MTHQDNMGGPHVSLASVPLTVQLVGPVRTVHAAVAERAAAEAAAAVQAGLLSGGAVGQRRTGSGISGDEATPTRTPPASGAGQAQLGAAPVAGGALVGS